MERGVPVLAFGVVGPPKCCIICGYDGDDGVGGDVGDGGGDGALVGWNFFVHVPPWAGDPGVTILPNGMFRKENWFPETRSLLIIGERVVRRLSD